MAVRCANTEPAVAHLMVVHAGIVDGGRQTKHLRREPSNRRQHRIGCHDSIVLGRHQRNARIDQRLLRVEDVERGSLTCLGLFPNAVQRDFGCRDLRLGGCDLGLAGHQLAPGGDGVGTGLVARLFKNQTLLG